MKLAAFSVFDSKAKAFGTPFFASNDQVALRMFSASINSGDSYVAKFPADFTLFRVGDWDDEHGALVPVLPLVNCGLGSMFVSSKE